MPGGVSHDLTRYEGRVVGDGHCVALVRLVCGLPSTRQWRRGAHVLSEPPKAGTAVATFEENGHYLNRTDGTSHAAVFAEHRGSDGIVVLDQWQGRAAGYRTLRNRNGAGPAADDASRFYVIEV